ncbi:MAG TPA: DUF5996 family protein [Burkholderiaceae bacterium]|nr:DUF5996 family protein [Burkholderiaceae bacterium]
MGGEFRHGTRGQRRRPECRSRCAAVPANADASNPDASLLSFLQTTYRAAADLGQWDRSLECRIGVPGRPRPLDDSGRS